ncbi:MAG: molybdate ABC transporter permease subunit [Coriobacteriales bacterium]|nr:molybdate ABC transporter permease subunit [Coriobacteriales bacterium]
MTARTILVLIVMVSTTLLMPFSAQAAEEAEELTLDASGSAAALEGVSFAVDGFARNNKGTARAYAGEDIGYRYPLAGRGAFVVVALEDELLIYLPEETNASFGLDFSQDTAAQTQLLTLLFALDEANSNGGITLEQLDLPAVFTHSDTVAHRGCLIRFGVEVEPGYYYVTVTAEADALPAPDTARQASFVETGLLVPADTLTIQTAPEGLDALTDFLTNMDYRPFWVSLRTSLTAMIFVFVLGLAAARFSLKVSEHVKDVLDAVFTIPMVLPPTVIGFLLLVVFGNSTDFGRWLIDHGIELVFSWPAAVIAATVVAFPLLYRTARGAFEAQDANMLDAARTLGWGEGRIFFKLMLPLAWPSIAAGTVLAFARAMGEFGATLFVAGNYAGVTQTMPIAIYFQWMGGRSDVATFWVFVVILISFVVILFINLYARHTQKFRLGTTARKERSTGEEQEEEDVERESLERSVRDTGEERSGP